MRQNIYRAFIYLIGTAILTLGITLNVKTELGVSPITSISYCTSVIFNIELGNMTFVFFCAFVFVQYLLRLKSKTFKAYDLIQIPISLLFSKLISLFNTVINFGETNVVQKIIILFFAIVFTGIGAAVVLSMRVPPNAADGLVQTMADVSRKSTGFCKNIFDIVCVVITIIISLAFEGKVLGIGAGTIATVIFVGRVIALVHYLFLKKLHYIVGIEMS